MAGDCAVGGGGVSLILCYVSISGNILSNNMASGQSGCGRGIYLYESNVAMENDNMDTFTAVSHSINPSSSNGGPNIDENLWLTSNYAGYRAGGINIEKAGLPSCCALMHTLVY